MNRKTKAGINLILFLITVGINTLGALGMINGMSQREVSDTYRTLITPSPMIFSIWGLIYGLLLISLIYLLVKHNEERIGKIIDAISVPFWISSVANILWIVTFSYEWMGISSLLILVLVFSLAALNAKLTAPHGLGEKINALAFGLYNGWLIIATVVNIAAFLVKIQWNGFGLADNTWAVIILVAALVITLLIEWKLRNAVLPLPLAWAYFGIFQEHQVGSTFNGQFETVGWVALLLVFAYLVMAVALFIKNDKCVLPKTSNLKVG